ncbi:BRO-N domain-containing protein [Massilia oculi]|uniref:BRO-N domain-containing protein n=1 Tax=Massilia oculi TaxID=945844 RepID=UPI001AAF5D30
MNSTPALTFKSKTFNVIDVNGKPWMTLADIAAALYEKGDDQSDDPLDERGSAKTTPRYVTRIRDIYRNHADEFTPGMTAMTEMMTAGGKQMVRIFSLRGAHLLAMFARTKVAKEFRRWVLDILDPQVEVQAEAAKGHRLDDETLHDIESLCTQAELLRSWWERVAPGIRALNRTLAGNVHDNFVNSALCSRSVVRSLGLMSNQEYAAEYPWGAGHTERREYVQQKRRIA